MFSFTLYITTDCNLKCQYCYEDYHNHYQLNEKTLVDSLEFIMNYGDRDLTEEQIHKTLWKEYEISGADRMFVERASKILEPYEGESEDEK